MVVPYKMLGLKHHHHVNQIYTYVGEILLAVNPYEDLGIFSSNLMFKYRNRFKFDNPPHAFAMANHAYHAMIHDKKNQVWACNKQYNFNA